MALPTLTFACPVESSPDTVVLQPVGDLDIAAIPLFEAAWADADTDELTSVVLDLSRLEFIDSSGLRAIVGLRAAIGRRAELTIIPGPPRIQRVFELTGLQRLLPFIQR